MLDQPEISGGHSLRDLGEREKDHDPGAAGFVLAGGQSTRMGRDKALLPFAGQPLIVRAIENLRSAGISISVAGARDSIDPRTPVVADSQPGLGPLGGICAALESTRKRWSVFLPVDLPLLPASLLAYLVRRAQTAEKPITIASVSGFAQTFPAVIDRSALGILQAELKAGRRGCYAAFQAAAASLGQALDVVPVELLLQSGQVAHPAGLPACFWFLNVNTPPDIDRARAIAASHCVS